MAVNFIDAHSPIVAIPDVSELEVPAKKEEKETPKAPPKRPDAFTSGDKEAQARRLAGRKPAEGAKSEPMSQDEYIRRAMGWVKGHLATIHQAHPDTNWQDVLQGNGPASQDYYAVQGFQEFVRQSLKDSEKSGVPKDWFGKDQRAALRAYGESSEQGRINVTRIRDLNYQQTRRTSTQTPESVKLQNEYSRKVNTWVNQDLATIHQSHPDANWQEVLQGNGPVSQDYYAVKGFQEFVRQSLENGEKPEWFGKDQQAALQAYRNSGGQGKINADRIDHLHEQRASWNQKPASREPVLVADAAKPAPKKRPRPEISNEAQPFSREYNARGYEGDENVVLTPV